MDEAIRTVGKSLDYILGQLLKFWTNLYNGAEQGHDIVDEIGGKEENAATRLTVSATSLMSPSRTVGEILKVNLRVGISGSVLRLDIYCLHWLERQSGVCFAT